MSADCGSYVRASMSHRTTQISNRPDYRPNPASAAAEANAIRNITSIGPARPQITASEARARQDVARAAARNT